MNKPFLASGLLVAVVITLLSLFHSCAPSLPFQKAFSKQDRTDLAIEQEFERTKDLSSGIVPRERLLEAVAFREAKLAEPAPVTAVSVTGINWQERGPNNVGGRTRALMFDKGDAANGYKKVWAGGVGGGLWYTNDITLASPVWNRVNDLMENLSISCLAQHPSNSMEMYAGTGEGWFNADAIKGLGIWKTTNGGITWTRLASTSNFAYVNDLLFDNGGNLYAGLRQNSASDAKGIQKSTDGGTTWTEVLGTASGGISNRGADLELAANGDIYASFGQFTTGGIYRSSFAINGAATGNVSTWTNITPSATGTMPAPANAWFRIKLATAPSNANIVYALFQGFNSNDCISIQQYNSSTNTWAVKTVPTIIDQGANSNFTRGQAWYDLVVTVDPANENSLYIAGIDGLRSDNGGTSWTQMTTWSLFGTTGFTSAQNIHADHHVAVYAPGSSARALWGTDGGIYYTTNANIALPGKPSFAGKNTGYNVTQFYSCAIHPTFPDYFLAGAQDNGTQKYTATGLNNTTEVSGGDGAFCHIDQDNANIQITAQVYNNYFVSTNGGASFTSQQFNNEGGFINPSDYDNTGNRLYAGDTAGKYFRWDDPATGITTASVSCSQFGTGRVTHVLASPVTLNRVFFGLNNGSIVMVDNAHSGAAVTGTVIKTGAGSVSSIAIDPGSENHLLVTYSNYGATSIFESFNALSATPTWTSVEGNLPDMPVYWAMFDPRNSDWALIATEVGVWSTDNLDPVATDWDPTNSGLANVRVDMLQYRASDKTIAAATHGRGLFTAVLPASTTPDINFVTSASTVTEITTGTAGCRNFTDLVVNVSIANPPTGAATITYAVTPGTAASGADYELTTNGNFAAPSMTHTFPDGLTASQAITIRVYNDAQVETPESFVISYVISGATNALAGSGAQTHTVSINDNDILPTGGSTTVAAIGANQGTINGATPFRSNKQKHRLQALFTKAEFNAVGISTSSNITSLAINVATKNSTRAYTGFTVAMANSTATDLSGGFVAATFTTVYTGNFTTIAGNNTISFSTPFAWDGTSNIAVQFCFSNGPGPNALADIVSATGAPLGSGVPASIYSDQAGEATAGCSLNAAFISDLRTVITFTATVPATPVATALNTLRNEHVAGNTDQFFYSASGALLARIKNIGTHNYGCTEVMLDRAGTGTSAFWNNNAANFLMNKTFQVLPTTNNTSGQYEITLYYTDAEKLGYEAATGQSWSTVQLIKVPSQISNYTPTTPNPDGGGVQMVSPIIGTMGAYHTLTHTFSTGFSGFGVGRPGFVLPVTLLHFKGKPESDAIVLDWSTSSEYDAKQFEVQKSSDGLVFSTRGFVNAAGNSSVQQSYSFSDKQMGENNYYRLKIFDHNGSSSFSQVVLIKNQLMTQKVWVVNNPFQDFIDLRFAKNNPRKTGVELIDAAGNLVFRRNYTSTGEFLRVDLSSVSLPPGAYILRVEAANTRFTSKVFKK